MPSTPSTGSLLLLGVWSSVRQRSKGQDERSPELSNACGVMASLGNRERFGTGVPLPTALQKLAMSGSTAVRELPRPQFFSHHSSPYSRFAGNKGAEE